MDVSFCVVMNQMHVYICIQRWKRTTSQGMTRVFSLIYFQTQKSLHIRGWKEYKVPRRQVLFVGTCSRHSQQPFVWCTCSFGSAATVFSFLESHRRMNRERGRLADAYSIHLSERILWRSDVEPLTRQRRSRWQMNRNHSSLHYIITHYAQNFPSAIERLISFWLDI